MRILFSPVGDTDPIRGFRDGAILHILRHYHPELLVVFMTADMVSKEAGDQRYTKAFKHYDENLKIEFLKTDITDPHHIDSLAPLAESFVVLKNKYPDAEFLLNLSSGTPQMKVIMAFLANDFNVKGIQVDSPERGSNRHNPPNSEKEKDMPIEDIIATNEDDEGICANRCSEPTMKLIVRYRVRNEILSLTENYEYLAALRLYERNKDMFSELTGILLKHAADRMKMNFKDAFSKEYIDKVLKISPSKFQKRNRMYEYFDVMKINQKKGELFEFVVKITPFLYELTYGKFCDYVNNRPGLSMEALGLKKQKWENSFMPKKIYRNNICSAWPEAMKALDGYSQNAFKTKFRDGVALTYYHILIMLGTDEKNREWTDKILQLRVLEEELRNRMAHTIVTDITEDDVKKISGGKTSKDVIDILNFTIMRCLKNYGGNSMESVYDALNIEIKNSMEHFGV